MYIHRFTATCALAVMLGTAASAATAATPGRGVERQGSCARSSDWRLEAELEGGRLNVDAYVDSGVSGQRWSWRILHNGGVSARGNATTGGNGWYEVSRALIDAPGVDRIVFKSHNAATGEQCNGSVRI